MRDALRAYDLESIYQALFKKSNFFSDGGFVPIPLYVVHLYILSTAEVKWNNSDLS